MKRRNLLRATGGMIGFGVVGATPVSGNPAGRGGGDRETYAENGAVVQFEGCPIVHIRGRQSIDTAWLDWGMYNEDTDSWGGSSLLPFDVDPPETIDVRDHWKGEADHYFLVYVRVVADGETLLEVHRPDHPCGEVTE